MGYRYIILGAGRQGRAAAYDLARFGDADEVLLADVKRSYAEKSAARLGQLLPGHATRFSPVEVRADREDDLVPVLRRGQVVISCVPYYFNPIVARAAIAAGIHMCDLGGDIEVVQQQLALDPDARNAGVTIVPDCGVAPGMNNLLAVYGMEQLDRTDAVEIRCGGLPQTPRPPLDYRLVFNLEGMFNNYFGRAYVLRDGRVTQIDSFTELETITFPPPLGSCEAFVTAGATSTCPWSFQGKVRQYNYKTVRYPGHYAKIKLLVDLGLLDTKPVTVKGQSVVPRDVVVRTVGDRIAFPDDRDLIVLRVVCDGEKAGRRMRVQLDLLERFDPETGFSAMERTTGYAAAIIASMLARGEHRDGGGVLPQERSIPARTFVEQIRRRGITVKETVEPV